MGRKESFTSIDLKTWRMQKKHMNEYLAKSKEANIESKNSILTSRIFNQLEVIINPMTFLCFHNKVSSSS